MLGGSQPNVCIVGGKSINSKVQEVAKCDTEWLTGDGCWWKIFCGGRELSACTLYWVYKHDWLPLVIVWMFPPLSNGSGTLFSSVKVTFLFPTLFPLWPMPKVLSQVD